MGNNRSGLQKINERSGNKRRELGDHKRFARRVEKGAKKRTKVSFYWKKKCADIYFYL